MTTAPNIEMIASSLRHCSLNGSGRRRGGGEGGDDSESVTVELNSDVALPYHWEQYLDIRTGQVYYINWEDGTRTTVDPRTSAFISTSPTPRSTSSASRRSRQASNPSSGYTSVSSVGAEEVAAWPRAGDVDSGYDNDNEEDDEDEDEEEEEDEEEKESSSSSSSTGSSRGSAVSSTLSSFSPTDESASGDNGSAIGTSDDNNSAGHVLVAAGCRACFMYFMVPKRADVCPKCGSSGLLHLSRNGYA